MTLADSAQVRLARMYPGAQYRATTSTVQVPIPRAGGVGAPRIRDLELVHMVADWWRRWMLSVGRGGHTCGEEAS